MKCHNYCTSAESALSRNHARLSHKQKGKLKHQTDEDSVKVKMGRVEVAPSDEFLSTRELRTVLNRNEDEGSVRAKSEMRGLA